jgi:integrase
VERPALRPKAIELYRYLLRHRLLPTSGAMLVADIRELHVRRWRRERLDAEVSAVTVAWACRLLKAILNPAVNDGLIPAIHAGSRGAAPEDSPERPVLTPREVLDLVATIDPRYRALSYCSPFRRPAGEPAALRRKDIDLRACTVSVAHTLTELSGGGHVSGPPKSDGGSTPSPFRISSLTT